MRERRRGRDRLRVLRRGVGLGLALVTVWGVGLTADLSGVGEAVRAWSADSQAVVGLLAEQLGQVPEETALAGMDGLGRLMVEQSALLSAGLEAVDALRQEQEGVESTPPRRSLRRWRTTMTRRPPSSSRRRSRMTSGR